MLKEDKCIQTPTQMKTKCQKEVVGTSIEIGQISEKWSPILKHVTKRL